MARQATAKLTSEERCKKAFDAWFMSSGPATPIAGGYYERMEIAWKACWRYLQTTVTKEFIES